MYLTFILKDEPQSQVIYFEIAEILNVGFVRINTTIKLIACKLLELSKVIQWMYMTLNSKVYRPGHIIYFNYIYIIFIIHYIHFW